jgi:glycosyltransferase involved in cell wall biosynthesis
VKILFDHQIFASQVYGGISRYFTEVGARVAAISGVEASVLCPLYVNAYLDVPSPLRVHGRRVRRLGNSAIAMRTLNATLSPWWKSVRSGVDVYHETYFSRIDIAPKGAAKVATVHDMVHEKFPGAFPPLDRTRDAKRAAILRADHVICVSDNTRRDLLEWIPLDPAHVSVVHHGSSMQSTQALPASQRERRLLYVGGRGTYKNFPAFLQAFAASRLRKEGFAILCFGGGVFSPHEQQDIARLGLAGTVTQQSGNDSMLEGLFGTSTALVYPSLYEGFGIPPLEAMSCGCPVLCSGTSSLPEVVGNAAEIFDPSDPDSIRAALEAVALSPARAQALITAGYLQAARFSWETAATETLAAYRKAS